MDEKARAYLEKYAGKHDWPTDDDTLVEIARHNGNLVHREEFETCPWWIVYLYVRDFGDGMFVAYYDAMTSGDTNAHERGYVFDPETIHIVKPVEKTVTVYESV